MPDLHTLLDAAAPRPNSDFDADRVAHYVRRRRRHRRTASIVASIAVMASVAGAISLFGAHSDSESPSHVIAGNDGAPSVQTWTIPGARGAATLGDDIWVLMQNGTTSPGGLGGQWSVGRLNESTGNIVDKHALSGPSLQLTASDHYLWASGQVIDANLQAALDSNTKDLPSGGRSGVVHRIDADGNVKTWKLATVPTFLTAVGDEAWATTIDFDTNEWTLARIGEKSTVALMPIPSADWGVVLDGKRIWLNGEAELTAIDRETGEVLHRYPGRRLVGRTNDGTLWERIAENRIAPFNPARDLAGLRPDMLFAPSDGTMLNLGDGIVVGTTWFADPDRGGEPDAVLRHADAQYLYGPSRAPQPGAVLFTARDLGSGAIPDAVIRWVPSKDRIDPATRAPLVETPSDPSLDSCPPLEAGFLSDDAGEWAESSTVDPDLAGALRLSGPGGSYVQFFPGPAPWITDAPGSGIDRRDESITDEHLVHTSDGYAARVTVADPARPAPCDALNVIGHHVTSEETLQKAEGLAFLVMNRR